MGVNFVHFRQTWIGKRKRRCIEAVSGGLGKKDVVESGMVLGRATPRGRTLIWRELIKARVECESFVEQMRGAQGS